jgi:probable F420-dependent oxidoreductase
MNLGVTIPFDAPLSAHGAVLERLGEAGYTSFWTAETAGCDAFAPLVAAAMVAPDARLGTAIASVYGRGPALLAMNAAALADAAPGRVVVGIGASSAAMATGWNDRPYDRPLERVVDTVRFLRAALSGERVKQAYETFTIDRFALERVPAEVPPILVGALGPRMLAAGAREADGVVLNWLGADDVGRVVDHLADSAPGATPDVVARIFVCPSTDASAVRAAAKALIARYLTVPGYAASQRWLGRGEALDGMWRLWAGGDRAAAASAVPDQVVDELIVHGTPAECAKAVARYADAGVTVPVVKVLPLAADVEPVAAAESIAAAYPAA